MTLTYDAVVVGAGPYGLSAAAHLRGRGLQVAVFGKPLEMWRDCMPQGMRLRSHWWATNLSHPHEDDGFDRFLDQAGLERSYPIPIETFVRYGLWFQHRVVPDVDPAYVTTIERRGELFEIALEDGRRVRASAVVMAIGLRYYAHRPDRFQGLPAELVSHSSDHREFGRFAGREAMVIGAGQSAIEFAALLHEAGARVQVVTRRPINWLVPDRGDRPGLQERLLAPDASVAPGWINWVWDRLPFLFYRFPQPWKDRYNATYPPSANHWLRHRVVGKVNLREGCTVTQARVAGERLEVTLSDGVTLRADHVLLATGYRVDLTRLTMLHPSLQGAIRTDRGIPLLSPCFESTVPGLYFVGFTSVRAFGPLYRFVAGCGAAARRVASAVARAQRRKGRTASWRSGPTPGGPDHPPAHPPRLETNRAG
jgi:cation diffusion facilitator CzcD-associated flavoprotein CzcO